MHKVIDIVALLLATTVVGYGVYYLHNTWDGVRPYVLEHKMMCTKVGDSGRDVIVPWPYCNTPKCVRIYNREDGRRFYSVVDDNMCRD